MLPHFLLIKTIDQRVLRGPSLHAGRPCIHTVLDLGPLAGAVSTDFPGFGDALLTLLPNLHDFSDALARGALLAEVVGRIALELQRQAGAEPAMPFASVVYGRQHQVAIMLAYENEQIALTAMASALAIVSALSAPRASASASIVRRPLPTAHQECAIDRFA